MSNSVLKLFYLSVSLVACVTAVLVLLASSMCSGGLAEHLRLFSFRKASLHVP